MAQSRGPFWLALPTPSNEFSVISQRAQVSKGRRDKRGDELERQRFWRNVCVWLEVKRFRWTGLGSVLKFAEICARRFVNCADQKVEWRP